VRWPDADDLAGNAPYVVAHADGTYVERRDQRTGGGEWQRLGGDRLFRFLPGGPGWIGLANDADGKVAADAVRLRHFDLGVVALVSYFYPMWIAGEKGFWAQQGLDVELTTLQTNEAVAAA